MKKIVILTGAGISAESGLKTFRDSGGLWEGHSIEEVATPEAFGKNPQLVHKFYNARRRQLAETEPNAAHLAIARLAEIYKSNLTVITQNVDDLHLRSGLTNAIHIHGELLRKKCVWCTHASDCHEDLAHEDACPTCDRPGGLRPDIVWFGETPYHLERIDTALRSADLFISIGTSGHVYPAAGFAATAKLHGARTIELNKESTNQSSNFDEIRQGLASQITPLLVEELCSEV